MLRVRVQWTGPSSPLLTTHYFLPPTEDQAAATAAFTVVATFWNSVRAVISDAFTYTVQQQVDQLTLLGELTGSFVAQNAATAIGQDTGDDLPYQTQGMVRWNTNGFINGRRVIGKTFIPGPTETNNSSGVPVAAYLTPINAAAATFAAAGSNPVVWSDHSDETPPNGFATGIEGGVASTQWRVLRSRR